MSILKRSKPVSNPPLPLEWELFIADGEPHVYDGDLYRYGYDQRAEIFGSKGAVHSRNDSRSTIVLSNDEGVTEEKPLFFFLERYMASFTQEMKEFFEAIETDGEVPVGAIDAIRPVQIAEAALESLECGQRVKIRY